MRKDNPACYECPKGKQGLHTWRENLDKTATCKHCKLTINKRDAADCFGDLS